jgi:hypothetical protein
MRKVHKLLKLILFCGVLVLSTLWAGSANSTKARTADFVHSIKSTYVVREDKSAAVEYYFTSTNKVANNYLKTFSLNLPFQPKRITTDNSATPVKVKELKQISARNIYALELEFINPVFGLNKSYEWKIKFDVENIVLDHGIQNAIIVPTFNDEPSIGNFEVTVDIPDLFGSVRYVYGNGTTVKKAASTVITYKSEQNIAPSYTILLGPDQEYFFETLKVTDGAKIYLAANTPYQSVVYTEFPERNYMNTDSFNPALFQILDGEVIKGFISSKEGYDSVYENIFQPLANTDLVDRFKALGIDPNTSKAEVAKKVFELVCTQYELNEYITNVDTVVAISPDKKKVNPAELNAIYREVLTSFGIENRGNYGYVFPIQPFQRSEYITEEHVWTEFWDGTHWVVVDPTWRISSRGTDYFDKNAFHHVKFGTYQNIDDLRTFFANSGLVKLTPVTYESKVEKKLEVQMSAYNDTYLNKEFRLLLTNKSNQQVRINSLFPTIDISDITLKTSKIDLNTVIYPQSSLSITVPLEYGLILKNREGSVHVKVEYEDMDKHWSNKLFSHSITIRSNISGYVSQTILVVVILFVFVSIGSFALYRKKLLAA